MKPIIGFAGNGHLREFSFMAAHKKGFKCVSFTPGKTGDCVEDLNKCDIVYICPDRPSNIEPQNLVNMVLPHLKSDAVLVIHCQVEPGFTRNINRDRVYYHVETLRIKDAEERALNPEQIIIGTRLEGHIPKILMTFLKVFNCPIISMSYESAEFAKIAINIYLASQVCTTNTLVEIAKKIGATWDDIIPALQTDKRIGKEAYLQPGFGLSQHLMRDLETLLYMDCNINVGIIRALIEHANYRKLKAQVST